MTNTPLIQPIHLFSQEWTSVEIMVAYRLVYTFSECSSWSSDLHVWHLFTLSLVDCCKSKVHDGLCYLERSMDLGRSVLHNSVQTRYDIEIRELLIASVRHFIILKTRVHNKEKRVSNCPKAVY